MKAFIKGLQETPKGSMAKRCGLLLVLIGFLFLQSCDRKSATHSSATPATLPSGEVFRGVGGDSRGEIALTPGVAFFLIVDAKTGRTLTHFSGVTRDGGMASSTAGEGAMRNEPYIYYWDEGAKVLWFATPKIITNTKFIDGFARTEGLTAGNGLEHPHCPRSFEMPEDFARANDAFFFAAAK